MNLRDATVALRPRGLGEIFDLALRLRAEHDALFRRVATALLVPALGVCAVARFVLDWSWPVVWCVAILLGSVLQGAFTVAVGRLLFARTTSAREVLRAFAGRLPSYLGALLLSRLLVAVVSLTVVLGPSAWVRLLWVHETALLEGGDVTSALGRSSRVVRRHGFTVAGLWLGLLLAHLAWVGVWEAGGQALFGQVLQLGSPVGVLHEEGGSLYALAGYFASLPMVATARFLGYTDVRTRKEGWDVQLRFAAIQASDEGRIA